MRWSKKGRAAADANGRTYYMNDLTKTTLWGRLVSTHTLPDVEAQVGPKLQASRWPKGRVAGCDSPMRPVHVPVAPRPQVHLCTFL